jgi:hypothetical protein
MLPLLTLRLLSAKEQSDTEKRAADLMLAIDVEVEVEEEEEEDETEVAEETMNHARPSAHPVSEDNGPRLRSIDSDDDEEDDDDEMDQFTEGMMDITLKDEEEEDENDELGDRGMTFLPHFQSTGLGLPIWMPAGPPAIVPTPLQICQGGGGGEAGESAGSTVKRDGTADEDLGSVKMDSTMGKYRPNTHMHSPYSSLILLRPICRCEF